MERGKRRGRSTGEIWQAKEARKQGGEVMVVRRREWKGRARSRGGRDQGKSDPRFRKGG